jgi:hypothetical protein
MSLLLNDNNDLDFGIIDDDLSVKIATDGENHVIMKEGECENPFFVGLHEIPLNKLNEKTLYSTYKRAFVLCMRDSFNNEEDARNIFKFITTNDELKNLGNFFTLVHVSKNLLKNNMHYNQAVIVKKNYLEPFNHSGIDLEQDEIVIPLYELREKYAKLYSALYESQYSLNKLGDAISLTNFYNTNYKTPVIKQLSQMILNIKEADFWTNKYNCSINMTDIFNKRSFQYKEANDAGVKASTVAKGNLSKDQDVLNVINKLSKLSPRKSDYLDHIYKPDSYTDLASLLQNSKNRTYYAITDSDKLNITKEQVTELMLNTTDDKLLYDMFNTLLVSKDYCHMVLNNNRVLTKMSPMIAKYKPLYKYLFGYPWLSFCIEADLFKTKATKTSRFVFDIDTASKLPSFPFSPDDLFQNPYLSLPVAEKSLNGKNNLLSLYMGNANSGFEICTLDEFRWRFNVFTTNNPNKNILDGINWDCFAISGSIIPACSQRNPPLLELVVPQNNTLSEAEKWSTYFNHYYADSDIDLMCNKSSVFEFMDEVQNTRTTINKQLGTENSSNNALTVEPIKTLSIIVNGSYLADKLEEIKDYINKPEWKVDDIIKNISSNEVKEYFYELYTNAKFKTNRTHRKTYGEKCKLNPLYEDFFKVISIDEMNIKLVTYELDKEQVVTQDSDVCYYASDFKQEVAVGRNFLMLKISENIKFKLKSALIAHPIEVFRVKADDFFSVVARFHLSCVRGYYNGNNVYLLPSCITALKTGINMDYKYFAGVRDPIDILNKYRRRGFGTLLNENEKQHYAVYNHDIQKPGNPFYADIKNKENVIKLFGARNINDDMFKPLVFDKGMPKNIYRELSKQYLVTSDNLKEYYKTYHNYDHNASEINMFRFKSIDENGNITPLKKWVIDAFYTSTN